MEFVESIQAEGVVLERKAMGEGTEPKTPIVVEVDNENEKKDIDALDIEIPVLAPRVYREYKKLADLDVGAFGNNKVEYKHFSEEEQREIEGHEVYIKLKVAQVGDRRIAKCISFHIAKYPLKYPHR